ncbi:MAG: hypothetical protein K0V04_16660 [Deltaproteobacteria bacterium]|nr:hypothetical protein [Deltaproteobacteria bacterium]
MEVLFKKYFWVIKTLGIAAACGLAASAVTTQIGSYFLFDTESVEAAAPKDGEDVEDNEDVKTLRKGLGLGGGSSSSSGAGNKARDKDKVATKIGKRNIFCPTCVPEQPETPEGEAGGGVDATGRPVGPLLQPGETKSKLPLRLMATLEAEDAENSFATILDDEAGVAGLFGRGDLIRDGVVVMGVDQGLVHLRNKAALEYIELGDEPPKAPTSTRKPNAKTDIPPPKNDRVIPGAEEAINCPNETTCTVERAFVEKLMANPALLAKQARIVPKQKDNEVLGYKLYGIRRGSLPKLLGLKNGDMLTAVNGEELKGMDKAMALYGKLRRASNLSVSIQRKGKTITKEIQIQ